MNIRLRWMLACVATALAACALVAGAARSASPGLNLAGKDCVITYVDDTSFPADRGAITTYFGSKGGFVFAGPPMGNLERFLNGLASAKLCNDVVIYISGHGNKKGHVKVTKSTGGTETLEPEVLQDKLAKAKGLTFKMIVDACYSGTWTDTFQSGPASVLIAEASSPAGGTCAAPGPGAVSPYTQGLIDGMEKAEPSVSADGSGADKAARLIEFGQDASGWTGSPTPIDHLPPACLAPGATLPGTVPGIPFMPPCTTGG